MKPDFFFLWQFNQNGKWLLVDFHLNFQWTTRIVTLFVCTIIDETLINHCHYIIKQINWFKHQSFVYAHLGVYNSSEIDDWQNWCTFYDIFVFFEKKKKKRQKMSSSKLKYSINNNYPNNWGCIHWFSRDPTQQLTRRASRTFGSSRILGGGAFELSQLYVAYSTLRRSACVFSQSVIF